MTNIKEKIRMFMARARTIEFLEGKISLSGYSKEQADALVAHIKAFGQVVEAPTLVTFNEVKKEIIPTVKKELPHRAFAVRLNAVKQFEVVTVAYDVDSKDAQVVNVLDVGVFKKDAIAVFKRHCVDHNFV